MPKHPQQTPQVWKYLKIFFSVIITIGCAVATWRLFSLLMFEINPLHHGGDGLIYTTVGRGITHGLVPYRDLFEFKPPGMFLIVAVSLFLTKGMTLANGLQAISELGIVIVIQLLAWRTVQKPKNKLTRFNMQGGTFIFSVLLLLYIADRAGHFQTESIGTFFVLLYALLITNNRPLSIVRIVISSLLLMMAVGIKEPFVFTAFLVIMLMLPLRECIKRYAITLVVAGVIGVVVMALMGYLIPYLTIYVPELLGPRLHFWDDPWWSTGFYLVWLRDDIMSFSPSLLYVIVISLVASTVELAGMESSYERKGLLRYFGIAVVMWMIIASVNYYFAVTYHSLDGVWPITLILTAVLTTTWYLHYRSFYPETYQKGSSAIGKVFIGTFFIAVTVSLGGHLPQQFGFGTAFYALLFVTALMGAIEQKTRLSTVLFTGAIILSFVGIVSALPRQNYAFLMEDRIKMNTAQQASAKTIDDVMDACQFDRYVIIGEPPVPWGYTKHAPFGPAFSRSSFTYPVEWRQPPIQFLQDAYFDRMKNASVLLTPKKDGVLVDLKDVPQNVIAEFVENFDINPPECAKQFQPMMKEENFLFFFRKNTRKVTEV